MTRFQFIQNENFIIIARFQLLIKNLIDMTQFQFNLIIMRWY